MSVMERLLDQNARYAAEAFGGPLPAPPSARLALLTCMDCRIDPLAVLGLQVGEAHVIRNAGGLITDDVLRSLAISQRELGTREVAVIEHLRCGLIGFDDAAFRDGLAAETGQVPPWRSGGITDLPNDIRAAVRAIRECPWLPYRDEVSGYVYDVDTGRLTQVE